jgi:outer membrane protein OmpA-like peptidoglycan-associated protein
MRQNRFYSAAVVVPVLLLQLPLRPAVAAAQSPQTAPAGLSARRMTAVSYEARRTTSIDLAGTPLMPRARGEVEIKTEASGPVQIKAKVRALSPAAAFGPEYLTFVLWAIPPQGRAKNLGEVRLDDGESEIEATADMQTFALVVTAEPYYAVTTPSDVVVLENLVREDTKGRTQVATLQYELMARGSYLAGAAGSVALPAPGKNDPPDVQQARNAVAIAKIAEAGRFAAGNLATAQQQLAETEQLVASKGSKRDIVSHARAAVQTAEEARLQSVAARSAEALRSEQAAAAAREADARAREQAARQTAATEAAARATADQERQRAQQAAQQAAQDRQRAEAAAQQANVEKQRADEARREADQLRAEAQQLAANADQARVKAEQEQVELRATLLRQFGEILETRDSTRGLIVNVGDVLFETGRFELRPAAREKLARFAGIVLSHSGLTIQSEGFTDSTGTAATNEKLSLQRADAVGDYLVSQGVTRDRINTRGFGPDNPVASNDTREGRQQNRRVELVVAGDVIGTPITGTQR